MPRDLEANREVPGSNWLCISTPPGFHRRLHSFQDISVYCERCQDGAGQPSRQCRQFHCKLKEMSLLLLRKVREALQTRGQGKWEAKLKWRTGGKDDDMRGKRGQRHNIVRWNLCAIQLLYSTGYKYSERSEYTRARLLNQIRYI
jgi:hypothetical protein